MFMQLTRFLALFLFSSLVILIVFLFLFTNQMNECTIHSINEIFQLQRHNHSSDSQALLNVHTHIFDINEPVCQPVSWFVGLSVSIYSITLHILICNLAMARHSQALCSAHKSGKSRTIGIANHGDNTHSIQFVLINIFAARKKMLSDCSLFGLMKSDQMFAPDFSLL